MKRWVAGVLVVLLGAFAAAAMGRKDAPPAGADGRNSLELIAAAEQRGELDVDEATLYRVYAVVGADELPPVYRGGAPIRDGTPVLRDARSRFDSLRPETQERLRPYLYPRGAQ